MLPFTVAKLLELIRDKLAPKCLMLVITPADSYGTTKFFEFVPPANMHRYAVIIVVALHLDLSGMYTIISIL